MFRSNIPSSEITPKEQYLSRRDFMKAAGFLGAGALLAACAPKSVTQAASASDLNKPAIIEINFSI